MSKKFPDYPLMTKTRELMRKYRQQSQMSLEDCSKAITEETGYFVTSHQLYAMEQGITKNIPLWAVIGYMRVLPFDSADRLFPYVGTF